MEMTVDLNLIAPVSELILEFCIFETVFLHDANHVKIPK